MSSRKTLKEPDPVIVDSVHSCMYQRDGITVEVSIIRLGNETEWSLEVIDEAGTSTVWDDTFESETAAWTAFIKVIDEEGLAALVAPVEPRLLH
ncbi:MAG: hypothetical protein ABL973_00125 [Micropepsaceae bacterium]